MSCCSRLGPGACFWRLVTDGFCHLGQWGWRDRWRLDQWELPPGWAAQRVTGETQAGERTRRKGVRGRRYVPYVSYVPYVPSFHTFHTSHTSQLFQNTRGMRMTQKSYIIQLTKKSAKPGNADRGTEKKKGDWAKRKVNPTTENNLGKNQLLVQGKPWLWSRLALNEQEEGGGDVKKIRREGGRWLDLWSTLCDFIRKSGCHVSDTLHCTCCSQIYCLAGMT